MFSAVPDFGVYKLNQSENYLENNYYKYIFGDPPISGS